MILTNLFRTGAYISWHQASSIDLEPQLRPPHHGCCSLPIHTTATHSTCRLFARRARCGSVGRFLRSPAPHYDVYLQRPPVVSANQTQRPFQTSKLCKQRRTKRAWLRSIITPSLASPNTMQTTSLIIRQQLTMEPRYIRPFPSEF